MLIERIGWLAVRADDARRVMCDVDERLSSCEPIAWEVGVERACAEEITFATAARGWVIVIGGAIQYDEVQALEVRVERLSATYGEAQAFIIDRASQSYRWLRGVDGRVVRSFATSDGRIVRDEGERGGFEQLPAEAPDEDGPRFLRAAPAPVDAASVLRAAAAWSLDLALLEAERHDGLASSGSWTMEWRAPVVMDIGAVSSEKEAEWHAAQLSEQGCPRCGNRLDSCGFDSRTTESGVTRCFTCTTCRGHFTLAYANGEGWDDQPLLFEPQITHRRAPSALLSPDHLLKCAERSSLMAQREDGIVAMASAAHALAALHELEKHTDFVIPDPAKFKKLKKWLRSHLP
jgi:hypothetical protein